VQVRARVWSVGVTQQLIDDTRLAPENAMLSDMQNIVNVGGDIQYRGPHGETPVRRCIHLAFMTKCKRVSTMTVIPLKFMDETADQWQGRLIIS